MTTFKTVVFRRSKHDENYTRAVELADELKKFEITFDTGIDENNWYWELDWSLVGATDQTVCQISRNENIDFDIVERVVEEE